MRECRNRHANALKLHEKQKPRFVISTSKETNIIPDIVIFQNLTSINSLNLVKSKTF